MSEPATNAPEAGDTGNGTAAAVNRAQSLLKQFGSRLKDTGAKLQEAAASPEAPLPSAATPESHASLERAEETLDRAGEQLGVFAAGLSHRARRAVALVREEAEDIWAEAQSLRPKNTL